MTDTSNVPRSPELPPRERFLRGYANLPLGTRDEIVAVIDRDPVSWKVAYLEIMNDTERSRMLLEQLVRLDII